MNLSDVKLFVAVPAYKTVDTDFVVSLLDLSTVMRNKSAYSEIHFVTGSSLVMCARNELVERFLASECTHLMFIDSDIVFTPEQVLELIDHASPEKKVICGLYPKKKVNWELIHHITNLGAPVPVLETQSGTLDDSLFSPIDPPTESNLPVRVEKAGSGFIMIERSVFTTIKEKFPEYAFHEKKNYEEGFAELYAWYDTRFVIKDGVNQQLGEDVSFCYPCRDAGIEIWCCPWINVGHIGNMEYKTHVNYVRNN